MKRDGQVLYLGLHDTPEEASRARAIAVCLYDNKASRCLRFEGGHWYSEVQPESAGDFTIPPLIDQSLKGQEKVKLVVRTTKEVHEKFKLEKRDRIKAWEEISRWLETDVMVPDSTAPPGSLDVLVNTSNQGHVPDLTTLESGTDHLPALDLPYASLTTSSMEGAFSGADTGRVEELWAIGSCSLSPESLDSPTGKSINDVQAEAGSHEQQNRSFFQFVNNLIQDHQRLCERVTHLEQTVKGLLQHVHTGLDQNSEAPQKRTNTTLQRDANNDDAPSSPEAKRSKIIL